MNRLIITRQGYSLSMVYHAMSIIYKQDFLYSMNKVIQIPVVTMIVIVGLLPHLMAVYIVY